MKERVAETNHGITGELTVCDYDKMQRHHRNIGLVKNKQLLKAGIEKGNVLEVGPGPGYLGLEWLKTQTKAILYWLEISQDMINMALKNAEEYRLKDWVKPHLGDATKAFPFENSFFDGVFTAGSMHEWEEPLMVINEMERVLKIGGKFHISDLKRNTGIFAKIIMRLTINQRAMIQGLKASLKAAYAKEELGVMFEESNFKSFKISESAFGLTITGTK